MGLRYVGLNGEPLEVDCFKCLGSQVAVGGDVKGMRYAEWKWGTKHGSAEKCSEKYRIRDKVNVLELKCLSDVSVTNG